MLGHRIFEQLFHLIKCVLLTGESFDVRISETGVNDILRFPTRDSLNGTWNSEQRGQKVTRGSKIVTPCHTQEEEEVKKKNSPSKTYFT